MKKVENIPMMSRPRMTAEPVSVRSFRMRSGMIGFSIFDSSTRKPRNNATPRPRMPRVWAEAQPSVAAVTMA